MPKLSIYDKKDFKLLGLEKAVVKFAAAPRRFPSSIAIAVDIYLSQERPFNSLGL